MTEETRKRTVYEALIEVYRRTSGGMAKDKTLQDGQRYSYLSDDKVTAELHKVMAEAGLVIVPEEVTVLDVREGKTYKGSATYTTHLAIRWRMYGEDGSNIQVASVGEGMDMGDKSYNKAMTAARKYAMRLAFCIGTGEDPDDAASVEHKPAPAPRAASKPAPARDTASAPDHGGGATLAEVMRAIGEAGFKDNEGKMTPEGFAWAGRFIAAHKASKKWGEWSPEVCAAAVADLAQLNPFAGE
jgi:hypothetical protein